MAAFDLPRLAELGEAEIARFRRDGFLVIERILAPERIEALRARFPLLFAGSFDTGIYPDEWYWREGMSLPDVTRHMGNAWKADLTVARLALSADIGRAAARLADWSGTRLGQDTIWWKAPLTKPIAHHQDTSFTGLARSAGDRDLLGDPRRHAPRRRHAGICPGLASLAAYEDAGGIPRPGRLPRPHAGRRRRRRRQGARSRSSSRCRRVPASSTPARSGTAPARTARRTACAAPSACTWCRRPRASAIGPAATSTDATSAPATR